MKNWKKLMTLLLVLSMLMVAVAGCGKDDADEDWKHSEDSDDDEDDEEEEEAKDEDEDEEEEASEEAEEEEPAEPVDTRTPLQKFWGGDWYGIMWITNGTGNYESYNNQYWDAMATLDVDESGAADMVLWYESLSREKPVAHVQLTISEDSGSGEMGAAMSESGWMFVDSDTGNGDIKHADWIIDPMTDPFSSKYGNDMIHIEGEFIDGSGGIYYHFFLRKWGTLWDDVAKDPEMLIPGLYEEWYKPLVQDGYAMPDNFGDPGTVKLEDVAMGRQNSAGADGDASRSTDPGNDDGGSGASDGGSTYDGGELVLVDDEYCKVVITGMGAHPYNDSWIGYTAKLTNKSDFNILFTSYAEPDTQEQTMDSIGTGNTCYFKGDVTKTHFQEVINAGQSTDKACLVIDGVTDVSSLGGVKGYIVIVNNETGEILNNVPYSF